MTHKPYWMPSDKLYQPLLVGASIHDGQEGTETYLKDNVGDNISEKNSMYSELTGLYWIWKHPQEDVIGLCHYRRYFCHGLFPCKNHLLTEKELKSLMVKTDLILPRKRHYYIETIESQYEHAHHKEDIECAKSVINKIRHEYLEDFEKIMKRRSLHLFNMFIARRDLVAQYCEWLFPILAEVEKTLDVSHYDARDKRVMGYLAERLFDVWITHNQIAYIHLPVCNLEHQNWARKIMDFLKRKYCTN